MPRESRLCWCCGWPSLAAAAQDWTGAYISGHIGFSKIPEGSNNTVVFDRNLDGDFSDTITTAAGANAFSPGFCVGAAVSRSLPAAAPWMTMASMSVAVAATTGRWAASCSASSANSLSSITSTACRHSAPLRLLHVHARARMARWRARLRRLWRRAGVAVRHRRPGMGRARSQLRDQQHRQHLRRNRRGHGVGLPARRRPGLQVWRAMDCRRRVSLDIARRRGSLHGSRPGTGASHQPVSSWQCQRQRPAQADSLDFGAIRFAMGYRFYE